MLLLVALTDLVQVSLKDCVYCFAQILLMRQVSTYPTQMASEIIPNVRVDGGSHPSKTPSILSFFVSLVLIVVPGLLFFVF